MLATKCVTQSYSGGLDDLLAECLAITFNAINYAEEHGIADRKGMRGFYRTLKDCALPSCYKVSSITRACAIIKSRMKSEKRGIEAVHPKPLRPVVCITTGFFVTMKGRLFIPLRRDRYFDVQLNRHSLHKLANKKVRSLTVTADSLSFCYSEEIEVAPVERTYGVDRNEKNITFGGKEMVVQVDMSKLVKVKQTTR